METGDLAARVAELEASNRRLRAWGAGVAVVLAAVVALGQTAPPVKALEAESLTLRDGNGKARIRIGPADGGAWEVAVLDAAGGRSVRLASIGPAAGLFLRADGGKMRGHFAIINDLPIWDLFDATGNTRCGASVAKEGSAGISIFGKDGATRAGLINNPDDSTRLTLRTGPNDKEQRVCEIKTFPQGAAQFVISDPVEKTKLAFGFMPGGNSGFNVIDGANKPRIVLGVQKGTSVLQLFGAPGVKGAELHALDPSALPKGAPAKTPTASLLLFDGKGEEVLVLPEEK